MGEGAITCDVHADRRGLPDCPIGHWPASVSHGILIHASGGSTVAIVYGRWCGAKIPENSNWPATRHVQPGPGVTEGEESVFSNVPSTRDPPPTCYRPRRTVLQPAPPAGGYQCRSLTVRARPRCRWSAPARQPGDVLLDGAWPRDDTSGHIAGTPPAIRSSLAAAGSVSGSRSWTRTNDRAINSRLLYQLSYPGPVGSAHIAKLRAARKPLSDPCGVSYRGCGRGRGGTGRRAGLKIRFRKECRFDSDRPHHHPEASHRD